LREGQAPPDPTHSFWSQAHGSWQLAPFAISDIRVSPNHCIQYHGYVLRSRYHPDPTPQARKWEPLIWLSSIVVVQAPRAVVSLRRLQVSRVIHSSNLNATSSTRRRSGCGYAVSVHLDLCLSSRDQSALQRDYGTVRTREKTGLNDGCSI